MGLLELSTELIQLIFEQLESTPPKSWFLEYDDRSYERFDLNALSLTCKRLYPEAIRLLYAGMTDGSSAMHLRFLTTVEKSPRLAALVRRYSTPQNPTVYYTFGPNAVHDPDASKFQLVSRLRRALPLMVNLKELTIQWYYDHSNIFPCPADGVMPFQLDAFKYAVQSPCTRAKDEALDFLASQHELRYLQWGPNSMIKKQYLVRISQKLVHLDAQVATIHSILPGRSIKELRWHTNDLYKTTTNCFRATKIIQMNEIRALDSLYLVGGNEGHQLLEDLFQLNIGPFKELKMLSGYSFQDCSTDQINRLLRLFPCLEVLVLPYSSYSRVNSVLNKDGVISVMKEHRNIQFAYQFARSYRPREYRRWIREDDGDVDSKVFALTTGNSLVRYVYHEQNWIG